MDIHETMMFLTAFGPKEPKNPDVGMILTLGEAQLRYCLRQGFVRAVGQDQYELTPLGHAELPKARERERVFEEELADPASQTHQRWWQLTLLVSKSTM